MGRARLWPAVRGYNLSLPIFTPLPMRFLPLALSLLTCALLLPAWPAHAATFIVDSPLDAVDAAPGDGVCATSGGACTLRAAVQEANAQPGPDVVVLTSGQTYTLTLPGPDDVAASGDLDIRDSLTVLNPGVQPAIIHANRLDRALEVISGTVQLTGLWVQGGSVSGDGGGLRVLTGTVTLANVTFFGNAATRGGGLANSGGAQVVGVNVQVISNTASGNGGGLFNTGLAQFSLVGLFNSLLISNTAANGGGAFNEAILGLNNVTVSGNAATGNGGGVVNGSSALAPSGLLELRNATLSANRADSDGNGAGNGGGLYQNSNNSLLGNFITDTVRLHNTLIAQNTDGPTTTHPDCSVVASPFPASPPTSFGHNLLGSLTGCAGFAPATGDQTNLDPQLLPLGDYGGLGWTHALAPTSPAIDAGRPTGCLDSLGTPLMVDQRGLPRPVDGNNDANAVCDVGAFEFAASATVDLAVTLAAPLTATVGQAVTLTAVITSTEAASTVVLLSALPPAAAVITTSASQSACTLAGGLLTCPFGELSAGSPITAHIVVSAAAPVSLTFAVRVAALQFDVDSSNDTASVTIAWQAAPPPPPPPVHRVYLPLLLR